LSLYILIYNTPTDSIFFFFEFISRDEIPERDFPNIGLGPTEDTPFVSVYVDTWQRTRGNFYLL